MTILQVTQESLSTAAAGQATPRITQGSASIVRGGPAGVLITQASLEAVYAPPSTPYVYDSQLSVLLARTSGATNVTTEVTQACVMIAYASSQPTVPRQDAYTFVMDGHRFYVLPLGPEGDWAYDTTTKEWSHLKSVGFDGMNFSHGVMWGLRVIGGDTLYPYLYELDPEQPFDEGWREVRRIVTGGIATRGRSVVGVANFTLTASVNDDNATDNPITLQFSDDNGTTFSDPMDIPLTNASTQQLIWNSLGSFSAPGRIFQITDNGGPVRFDGADAVLTIGSGADSGQDQEGQHHP